MNVNVFHGFGSVGWTHGDGVVGSGDERDEERQHHVDEERDEGVEIELTEHPHQRPALLQLRERGKHVVSINERKQTLGHRRERAELREQSRRHGRVSVEV